MATHYTCDCCGAILKEIIYVMTLGDGDAYTSRDLCEQCNFFLTYKRDKQEN